MVSQTLLRASVASRTQSWGEGALPEAGERFVSAELGRYRLSSVSGCCLKRMLQCAQKVNQDMWSCENLRLAPVPAICALVRSVLTTHRMLRY